MDNLFLPREVGSIETGPQNFVGTNVLGTTFLFTREIPLDPPGLLNSVFIQNAGLNNLNGTFVYVTEFNNKPYYIKNSNPDWFIIWFENQWQMYDFSLAQLPIYFSSENVLYPWNVTNWGVLNSIYNPTPTVIKTL
jgi:hypothetical protein